MFNKLMLNFFKHKIECLNFLNKKKGEARDQQGHHRSLQGRWPRPEHEWRTHLLWLQRSVLISNGDILTVQLNILHETTFSKRHSPLMQQFNASTRLELHFQTAFHGQTAIRQICKMECSFLPLLHINLYI